MADVVNKAKRSQMMAGIRGKDTKPERTLRSRLHAAGLRYQLHVSSLPGKPDLVFPKYKAAIFVHGCFWHRHQGCWWCTQPATRPKFWNSKFDQNIRRDAKDLADLGELGWRVAVVWECALRLQSPDEVARTVQRWLESGGGILVLPATEDMRKRRTVSARPNESK